MTSIVSKECRIRYPEMFSVGKDSVIDDYCYFSTRIDIGDYCHIASSCTIAGGKDYTFSLGDYCSISAGVRIWCQSNDYVRDLVILGNHDWNLDDEPIKGNVAIGSMCGVGANSVIMPANNIPDGVVIGALSYVPAGFSFTPWGVYAGTPIHYIKERNRERVLLQKEIIESSSRKCTD